ncbi:hypothetical protein L6164_020125 [Bauhinia variegata]|uniref:Uncharacterized protein n=1 Tax=Bauhinia variegata TaxID=167791 RepID=A0ACB9MUJ0_BAUVA|nr:hypothetical protein L6164_020125 [Bauhinia variegata]
MAVTDNIVKRVYCLCWPRHRAVSSYPLPSRITHSVANYEKVQSERTEDCLNFLSSLSFRDCSFRTYWCLKNELGH